MNLEKVVVKRPVMTIFITVSFIFITVLLCYALFIRENLVTNWYMEVVGNDNMFTAGTTNDLHIFLYDEEGNPITDANVNVILDMPEMVHYIKKPMNHVENGLYETEVLLSMGGTWIGWIEANRGSETYINQFLLRADGGVMSSDFRDPKDYFNLDQPLPPAVQQHLE
ncbi:FixH family protein [Alkalihalobacterium alkalinitrilicum]|uniref:FixH family protein n=1 Tax=Alkalihalobacterium alkalinitrilicum TaxID=427920 RepID=UPI00099580E9|nr:FixH family protein [Alkalihalobacterium alkalinitrilicum]